MLLPPLLAVVVVVAPSLAQAQFAELPRKLLPGPTNQYNQGVTAGDFDGDGDVDLAVARGTGGLSVGQNRLFLNDGTGRFTDVSATHMPALLNNSIAVTSFDADGDGDLDLVFGNFQANRLYLNDGAAVFTLAAPGRLPVDQDYTLCIAPVDVDGDLDVDLVFGNGAVCSPGCPSQNRLYLNDGQGTFTDVTASQLPVDTAITNGVAVRDVDLDGDHDLILANSAFVFPGPSGNSQNLLYLNDGRGVFTDATASRMPVDNDQTEAMASFDADSDGDQDIVFANVGAGSGAYLRLYSNDGRGFFNDVTTSHMPLVLGTAFAVSALDVDGDRDTDLIMWTRASSATSRLLVNDGAGHYVLTSPARFEQSLFAFDEATCDVDGDGDMDVVLGDIGAGRVYFNLLRQIDDPQPLQIGGNYLWDVYARYGSAPVDAFVLGVGIGRLRTELPPLGTLWLDPGSAVSILSVSVVPLPQGVSSAALAVPNLPLLLGTPLVGQAMITPTPGVSRLTGHTFDTVR